jgi:hypothetical protein
MNNTSFERRQPRRYSFRWAEEVVQTWEEKHARVVQDLYKFPYFSRENLADLLISDPQSWYYLKAYVKKAEEFLRAPQNPPKTTTQALSCALKFFPNHGHATAFVVLTGCLEWSTLWEPFK